MGLQDAADCIYQFDADGDGMLDAQEFEDLKQQILSQQMDDMTNNLNAMDVHANIDADGDGKLSAAELATACNITEQEATNIIAQYDADGDGQLDIDEFNDLKTQILSQQREQMTDK